MKQPPARFTTSAKAMLAQCAAAEAATLAMMRKTAEEYPDARVFSDEVIAHPQGVELELPRLVDMLKAPEWMP